jgi:hypothetical protein
MSSVKSFKTYIQMWLYSQRHIPNTIRGSSFQIMTFIGLNATWEEKAFPNNHVYVRYVHLTNAKPVHKRQTHHLVRGNVT